MMWCGGWSLPASYLLIAHEHIIRDRTLQAGRVHISPLSFPYPLSPALRLYHPYASALLSLLKQSSRNSSSSEPDPNNLLAAAAAAKASLGLPPSGGAAGIVAPTPQAPGSFFPGWVVPSSSHFSERVYSGCGNDSAGGRGLGRPRAGE